MTDMPMTSPGAWKKGKPATLSDAIAGVSRSLAQATDTRGKVPSGYGNDAAKIRHAAEGLLERVNANSSGATVLAYVGQFETATAAETDRLTTQFTTSGAMALGPVIAVLASVADLKALANEL
jgi:hypothetical protein